MLRTLLVVVLNGKTYQNSATLNSLMNRDFSDTHLVIINTGPDALRFDKDFIHTLGFCFKDIEIKEFLDNRLLSKVYSDIFIEFNEFDRFILLDDGSIVNKAYLKNINRFYQKNIDLQMPNLKRLMDGKICFPIINGKVRKYVDGFLLKNEENIVSLASGLVVYRSFLDKYVFVNNKCFDEFFSFNDINSFYFKVLHTSKSGLSGVNIQIVNTLEHQLNGSANKSNKLRAMEFFKELILSVKSYCR